MVKKTFLILSALLLTGCQSNAFDITKYQTTQTTINQTEIQLAIADTPELQAQGFMFVDSIPDRQGMLFQYNSPAPRSFWMKNTNVELDIIFLNQDKEIINIHHNTPPCTKSDPKQEICPSYKSQEPAQFIIELPSPQAKNLKLLPGQQINFNTYTKN